MPGCFGLKAPPYQHGLLPLLWWGWEPGELYLGSSMFLAGLLGKVINNRAGAGEYKMGLEHLVGQKIRKYCKNDRSCQKNTGANLNG